jgi:MerR family transcriptional regulator, redox-sensitive transcriptional activator SoxR
MTIGEVGRRAGIRPSAMRYYERMGLLAPPLRRSGRRDYGPDAVANLAVVQFAREVGFTIAETAQLVRGFPPQIKPSARWTKLADAKLREMDAVIARAEAMKTLLRRISRCQCGTLTECGRGLQARRERPAHG